MLDDSIGDLVSGEGRRVDHQGVRRWWKVRHGCQLSQDFRIDQLGALRSIRLRDPPREGLGISGEPHGNEPRLPGCGQHAHPLDQFGVLGLVGSQWVRT